MAALADRQHGVVSRAQLFAIGLSERSIENRIERGLLHPLHRGVYAVGHRALRREAWWIAAVLAGAPGAVLSHRSAAALWGIRNSSRASVEVIAPRLRRRQGIEAHRIALREDEMTTERGIPVTTPARTLLDLASVLSQQHIDAAFQEAEVRRLTSPTSLDALVARYPRRRGHRRSKGH